MNLNQLFAFDSDKLIGKYQFYIFLTIICVIGGAAIYYFTLRNPQTKTSTLQTGEFEVIALNAGKADALILRTSTSTVLIDTGLKKNSSELVAEIKSLGIDTIDYLIITHFDKDHVGGAAAVIKELTVNNVIQSDYPKDSKEYKKYVKALEKKNLSAVTLEDTLSFTLDSVSYTVYPHLADTYSEQQSNNSSLIVSVEHGANRFLFAGDATDERLAEFLEQESNLDYDYLKVQYHGRYLEANADFFSKVLPSYAVITSSDDDKESDITVSELEELGTKVYLTRKGNVVCISDGDSLSMTQE